MKKLFPLILLVAYSIASDAQMTFLVTAAPCHNDGVIGATFTGSLTPPLTVRWITSGSAGATITHTGVSGMADALTSYSGGPISVIAFDSLGVTDTGYFAGAPPFNVCSLGVFGGICPAPDTLTVSICSGGTAPFTYSWYIIGTSGIIGTMNPMPAAAGNDYGVTVTDAAGCTYGSLVDPMNIYAYSVPTFYDSVNTTTAACTNGTASVSIYGGGVAPYSYIWSNGATSATIGSLVMGWYGVTVTDGLGCTATGYGYVNQSIYISAPTVPTPATCLASDGAVIAFGSGGTPPYSYVWSNGATTQSQSGIPAGFYGVNVTDANGCIGSDGGYVGVSTPITVNYTATPSLCTAPTGTATLAISGGTAPYTTSWYTTPPQTGVTAMSLTYGDYFFHVTDAIGCVQEGTVTVPPIDVMSASFLETPALCTLSNGSMTVYPVGGVTPYHYLWNTGATTATITGKATGYYSVTITDNLGCKLTKWQNLPYTSPLGLGAVSTPASCIFTNDGIDSAIVWGGTPPYSYAWSSGGTTRTISALHYGPYWVTATDAIGCTTPYYIYSYVDYDTLGTSCYCTIEGTVYNDTNGNCTQDPGEMGIPNVQIHIAGGTLNNGYTYTDAGGHYSYKVPSGSYIVSERVLAFYPLASCQPNNIPVTVTASAGCVINQDFANSMDTIHDMHISTWDYYHPFDPISHAVIGHTYTQTTIISNDGTVPEDSVYASYRTDGQIYGPSFIPGGYFSGSPYWYKADTFASMQPGTSKQFLINYTVPTNIPIGTALTFKDTVVYKKPVANWLTDYSPWNNVNYFNAVTVASFDPNFKEVNPKGTGPLGLIPYTDSVLEYMVHFQNTGTWPAENITVLDTLDDNLDWTSLTPVFQSSPCKVTLSQAGAKKIAKFSFPDINLPTKASDEVRSNGMLTYTIHLKRSLTVGSQIRNKASIYFDYNEPVMTNITLNTLQSAGPGVSVKNIPAVTSNTFSVYPNPANNNFTAIVNCELATRGELMITDVTGKTMMTKTISLQKGTQNIPVDVRNLPSGTYFVTLDENGVKQTQKLVIIKS